MEENFYMQNNIKIDAVVVLYNPDSNVIDNIKTYNSIDKIFVVDNSDMVNSYVVEELKKYKNLVYINNNGNKGIAYALNLGAKLSLEDGADWLLTMDQDSRFKGDSLLIMIEWIKSNKTDEIGILAPYHITNNEVIHGLNNQNQIYDVPSVMTSGNLLNLIAFKKVGKFNEKYFVDYVDHEYCLRLRKDKFCIKVLKNSILFHKLGSTERKKILGINLTVTNHNYIRRYYITRNRLTLASKYLFIFPSFIIIDLKCFFTEYIKILLCEDDKIRKQRSIVLGIIHFLIGKYGKYDFS